MIVSRFKAIQVDTLDGQSHARLKGADGFISLHRPASDNLTEGQEFVLQSVEAAKEMSIIDLDARRKIRFPEEPVSRSEVLDSRKDLLTDDVK